jgi:hydrogenase/urease accessory protein HupE
MEGRGVNRSGDPLRAGWRLAIAVALGAFVFPSSAEAHLVTTGLGPLYDGIGHVFVSPDDLLPVIAMALLAGLNGTTSGRWTLFVLPLAWLAGGIAGYAVGVSIVPVSATVGSTLLLGLLTAADRRLPVWTVVTLAAVAGGMHGWLNGAAIAEAGNAPLGLVGIVSAVFVLAALLAALVVSLRADWTRIVVRVAGSWIAAIGLLMLGWAVRGPA